MCHRRNNKSYWKTVTRKPGVCSLCGEYSLTLTADHVKPRSRGGPDVWYNIAPLCMFCNQAKGHKSLLDYMLHGGYGEPKLQREKKGRLRQDTSTLFRLSELPDNWGDPLGIGTHEPDRTNTLPVPVSGAKARKMVRQNPTLMIPLLAQRASN